MGCTVGYWPREIPLGRPPPSPFTGGFHKKNWNLPFNIERHESESDSCHTDCDCDYQEFDVRSNFILRFICWHFSRSAAFLEMGFNLPTVEKGFFCLQLQTGVLIIGVFTLVSLHQHTFDSLYSYFQKYICIILDILSLGRSTFWLSWISNWSRWRWCW